MTAGTLSRWWYLQLAADFPELEIHTGHGWGPEQELGQIELGERVMTEEALWLFTSLYSGERDRIWAAVMGLSGMVSDSVRRNRPEGEQVIRALRSEDPRSVSFSEIPAGWHPDLQAWEEGRLP